jgi:amidophosphoribosyltransferase
MMASESVALKFLGYTSIVDILPGQAVIIQRGSQPVFFQVQEQKCYAPDIFVSNLLVRTQKLRDSTFSNLHTLEQS